MTAVRCSAVVKVVTVLTFVAGNDIQPSTCSAHVSVCLSVCLSVAVRANQIKPDPLSTKNSKRRDFCAKHDGYGDFCDGLQSVRFLHCYCVGR